MINSLRVSTWRSVLAYNILPGLRQVHEPWKKLVWLDILGLLGLAKSGTGAS
jgi:hypothetical protein